MKGMGRILGVVLVAILIIAVAGTGYWGYLEHQDKNSLLIKAENNYQRAFHNLNNNMSNLEDELGKSLAMNSRELLAPCMANIWRISYDAQQNIGQLPLYLTPFNKTERFLNHLADLTHGIGMRDLENEPLTDEEWEQLQELHNQAQDLQNDLKAIQTKVLNENLRWMDVEMAVAAENKDTESTILNGIEDVDQKLEGFIETEFGTEYNKIGDKKEKINGETITAEEAKEIVREFLDVDPNVEMEVSEDDSEDYIAYSIHYDNPEDNKRVAVDVSKQGGHVLWYLIARDIDESDIGLHDAQNEALQFLEERGITSMTPVESDQYDNVGVFDFVYNKDGVRMYIMPVRVKVSLDNGDILGYEALDYVVNFDEDIEVPEPEITLEEAKANVNGNLEVLEEHLSMIEMEEGEYVLCYELLGRINNESYRVFINAVTGEEERVEKLKKAEPMV